MPKSTHTHTTPDGDTFLPTSYALKSRVQILREQVVMDLLDLGLNPSGVLITLCTSGSKGKRLQVSFPDGIVNFISLEG
jgi:hypothetical protein